MNRRLAIASMLGLYGLITRRSDEYHSKEEAATSIGFGLELRDYRLFPSKDVTRFIVEVHNTTDHPIESPTVGVILDHLPENEDFGIASPGGRILLPHSSAALFGVAPKGLISDNDWGNPKWILCEPPGELDPSTLGIASVSLEYSLEPWSDGAIHLIGLATNPNSTPTGTCMAGGTCLDISNRVCGLISPTWIGNIGPSETQEFHIWISPKDDLVTNPFVLVDSARELKFNLTPQPPSTYRPITCPSVMPWER